MEDIFTRNVVEELDIPLSEEEQIENVKARYHLSKQQIDAFKDTFTHLDKEKNGKILIMYM
jgi:Ca2+-binding EF-hand superfamily protein